jgi:hypothetical protein
MTNPPPPTPGNFINDAGNRQQETCARRLTHAQATLANIKILIEDLQDQLVELACCQSDAGPPPDQQ